VTVMNFISPVIVDGRGYSIGQRGTLICLVYDLWSNKLLTHDAEYRISCGSGTDPSHVVWKPAGHETKAMSIKALGQYILKQVRTSRPVRQGQDPEYRFYAIMYTTAELYPAHLARFWKQIARHNLRVLEQERRQGQSVRRRPYPPAQPLIV